MVGKDAMAVSASSNVFSWRSRLRGAIARRDVQRLSRILNNQLSTGTERTMKRTRSRTTRRRGISRIGQPSTRTFGWFVRADFYRRRDGSYVPRYRKFFGDVTHGGKRRALRAARAYLAKVAPAGRTK